MTDTFISIVSIGNIAGLKKCHFFSINLQGILSSRHVQTVFSKGYHFFNEQAKRLPVSDRSAVKAS